MRRFKASQFFLGADVDAVASLGCLPVVGLLALALWLRLLGLGVVVIDLDLQTAVDARFLDLLVLFVSLGRLAVVLIR